MAGRKYSKEQRDEFFRLLDKGGTVRAAARAVGVHQDAGYNWLRNSGLTMQRATPRTYAPEDKAEFFRRLADNPNVSAVARELGFTRVTCYSWAYKAGIRTSDAHKVNPRREEFLRLREESLTRAQARARVGADARSATDWDKGITIINRGRIYTDGRIVRYPEPTLVGVTAECRVRAIGGSVDLNKVGEGHRLAVSERGGTRADQRPSSRWGVDPHDRPPNSDAHPRQSPGTETLHRLDKGLLAPHRPPPVGSAARPTAGTEAVCQQRTSGLCTSETDQEVVAATDQ